MTTLTLGIPSKGRLMEATSALLSKAGFAIERLGADRGYRGRLQGIDGVEIAFLSASASGTPDLSSPSLIDSFEVCACDP